MLVFSKTSLQQRRISPRAPRAIYYSDEVYVGFCRGGEVLEVTAVDPRLGAVYYSLSQEKAEKPKLTRRTESCLLCHGSSTNDGLPGHLVRSVYPDSRGHPVLSRGSHRVDHTTPLADRWGGWYVTGKSGKQTHLGNLIVKDGEASEIDNRAGLNITDLGKRFPKSAYLGPHSDLVALMVLEHQTGGHNLITRAGFLTRIALYQEADINKALGRPAGYRSESTVSRIKDAGDPLVKYLLFCGEAKLTDRIEGTSGFAKEFVKAGPRDAQGRSLRDFDLRRRLFRYPCSYLIYSAAFDALPDVVRDHVLRRIWDVLSGKEKDREFAHLSAADRKAIREILAATKKNLPAYWRSGAPSRR
jgi:hypothetical protein